VGLFFYLWWVSKTTGKNYVVAAGDGEPICYVTYVDGFSHDSPKPDSPNPEKVHRIVKCSCFVEKNILCNSEPSQHS